MGRRNSGIHFLIQADVGKLLQNAPNTLEAFSTFHANAKTTQKTPFAFALACISTVFCMKRKRECCLLKWFPCIQKMSIVRHRKVSKFD